MRDERLRVWSGLNRLRQERQQWAVLNTLTAMQWRKWPIALLRSHGISWLIAYTDKRCSMEKVKAFLKTYQSYFIPQW